MCHVCRPGVLKIEPKFSKVCDLISLDTSIFYNLQVTGQTTCKCFVVLVLILSLKCLKNYLRL